MKTIHSIHRLVSTGWLTACTPPISILSPICAPQISRASNEHQRSLDCKGLLLTKVQKLFVCEDSSKLIKVPYGSKQTKEYIGQANELRDGSRTWQGLLGSHQSLKSHKLAKSISHPATPCLKRANASPRAANVSSTPVTGWTYQT